MGMPMGPRGGAAFPGEAPCPDSFPVIRRPGPIALWEALSWSEVILHNNLCLRMAWPLALLCRPWVIAHHIRTRRLDGRRGIRDRLKLFATRFARNIAVSQAVAADLPIRAKVIGNPYRDEVFVRMDGVTRSKPLLFVGRLIEGKGVDLLIQSLRLLEAKGITIPLTVVGEGPLREHLQSLASGLPVAFLGRKSPGELAGIYNEHRVVVIPSMCEESFGLAALEGIACGCLVIGSDDGGLPEAIGPCGWVVPKGDAEALAEKLEEALGAMRPEEPVEAHLSKHKAGTVARAYLEQLEKALE